jgi:hypothetical protein
MAELRKEIINMSSVFKRTIEDFTCDHCGTRVTGTGFTNHCPMCLWSKHCDITPGDRASDCNGLMEPIKIEIEKGEPVITHRCIVCGYEKRNKTAQNDSMDEIVKHMTHDNATDIFYRARKIQENAKKR